MDIKKELDQMTQQEYNYLISQYIPNRVLDKQDIIDQLQEMKDQEIKNKENKYNFEFLRKINTEKFVYGPQI